MAGCDNNGGEGFNGSAQLKFHAIGKHQANAGDCPHCGKSFKNLALHKCKVLDPAGGGGVTDSGPGAATGAGRANLDDDDELELDDGREVAPAFALDLDDDDKADEPRPRGVKARVQRRLWGTKDADSTRTRPRVDNAGAGSPPTGAGGYRETRPKLRNAKRATTAPIGTMLWGGLGAALERSGADVPVGRTLQFQSDAAGDILDKLIANTWADRVLQPFAEKTEELEALSALFALPVLVAIVERSEASAVALEPLLKEAVRQNIVSMAPVVQRKEKDAKKLAETAAKLGVPAGEDPVLTILNAIFAPPTMPPAPVDEPSPNGSDARAGAPAA